MAMAIPGAAASRRRYSALQVTPGRRLSALVPDAVARRLSTLGISPRNSPADCLIEQGKALCAQYMRSRTSDSGRKWRWRGDSWPGARLVFPRLSHLGRHLERARPRLYAAIGRHALPSVSIDIAPEDIVYSIGVELFKEDITWGKIVSLMAVCGALAKSAAHSGRTEIIPTFLEAATAAMQGPLLPWLQQNGGWYGLVEHCQPIERSPIKQQNISINVMMVTGSLLLICFLLLVIKYSVN